MTDTLGPIRSAFADHIEVLEKKITALQGEDAFSIPIGDRFEVMRLTIEQRAWQAAVVTLNAAAKGMPVGHRVTLWVDGLPEDQGVVLAMADEVPEPLNWDDPLYSVPVRWDNGSLSWEELGDLRPVIES